MRHAFWDFSKKIFKVNIYLLTHHYILINYMTYMFKNIITAILFRAVVIIRYNKFLILPLLFR